MRKAGIWFFIVLLNLVVVPMALDKCNAGLSDLAKEISTNLQEVQANLQQTAQEMARLVAENEKDRNNYKLYDNTLKQFEEPIAALLKRTENYKASMDSHNKRVDAWNAAYGGKKLPPAEYAIAQRDGEKLEREKASLSDINDNIKRDEIDLHRKIDPTIKEMNAIEARVKDQVSKSAELKKKFDQLQSRLNGLQQEMVMTCKEAEKRKDPEALEALKYCHSVNWDGAQLNLPPLTNPPPPFKMTPN
jgi:predicted nuclease with TOPRIM domain